MKQLLFRVFSRWVKRKDLYSEYGEILTYDRVGITRLKGVNSARVYVIPYRVLVEKRLGKLKLKDVKEYSLVRVVFKGKGRTSTVDTIVNYVVTLDKLDAIIDQEVEKIVSRTMVSRILNRRLQA